MLPAYASYSAADSENLGSSWTGTSGFFPASGVTENWDCSGSTAATAVTFGKQEAFDEGLVLCH